MAEQSDEHTRERILDQAERLFAVKGFEAVSIREITRAAASNLAAVNYYFGNKKNLYLEVFRQRWMIRTRLVRQSFAEKLAGNPNPSIPEILHAMARAFLDGPLSDEQRRQHALLMQREMARPGDALKLVVEEVMRPYHEELITLLRPNLPRHVDEERLRLCVLSILGMTLYFTFARPAVSIVMGRQYDACFKSQLIQHVQTFATDGLNGLVAENRKQ
ncbi:MAG TPA: CerR family C-terminal domain-containing protein [Desulfosalsimonadaceae bacterium]|nr:CerR family C-terminal domain-containing protein [Desulfosalsimonadaceae bacterium]